MADLQPPDTHFLLAAFGWLELGLPAEADRELKRISPPFQDQPDVLEARWQVCAALNDWEGALQVAESLAQKAPERDSGWIHRAYSLRRVKDGGLQAAWEALRPALEKFPKNPIVPYNLACYAAQAGRLDEAWEWLHKAMEVAGDVESIKKMALADDDLKALWERVREL
jgi:predicted Zn-dependent protease